MIVSVCRSQLADVKTFETKPALFQENGIQYSTNISDKQIEIVALSHHTHHTFSIQMIINCYCSPLWIPFSFTFDSFPLKCFHLSTQLHLSKSFRSCLLSYFGFEFSFWSFPFSMRLYLCAVVCVCVCVLCTLYILGSDICLLHHLMAKCIRNCIKCINSDAPGQNFIRICMWIICDLRGKLLNSKHKKRVHTLQFPY